MLDLPKLYTERETAAYLGVSPRTLMRARERGEIAFTVVGYSVIRYTYTQITEYLYRSTTTCQNPSALDKLVSSGSPKIPELDVSTSLGTTPQPSSDVRVQLARQMFGTPKSSSPST